MSGMFIRKYRFSLFSKYILADFKNAILGLQLYFLVYKRKQSDHFTDQLLISHETMFTVKLNLKCQKYEMFFVNIFLLLSTENQEKRKIHVLYSIKCDYVHRSFTMFRDEWSVSVAGTVS